MLEAQVVQAVGDAADYERGREVRVYDSYSTREQIDSREQFTRERRMLTLSEQWLVRKGYMSNPFVHEKPIKPVWTPVDYTDGRRRRYRSIEEARQHLTNDVGAVRLWNPLTKEYEVA